MKLYDFSLENFQGIKSFKTNFNGKNVEVRADNGVGKTTLGNAFLWLLTDKPLTDIKNFSPKTKDESGEDIHNLENSVEARIQLESGKFVTLKKSLTEDWRKKRGSNEKTFSGNNVNYYIDGVPVKESEYTMRITAYCDIERIKMLSIPQYFSESLDWKGRRHLLMDISGDISDDDVISSNDELKLLPDFLKKSGTDSEFYTVDEFNKIASAKMKDINNELKTIPARIDEAKLAAKDLSSDEKAILSADFGTLQTSKYMKDAEMQKLKDGSNLDATKKELLSAAQTKLSDARITYQQLADEANASVQSEISSLRDERTQVHNKLYDLSSKLRDCKRDLSSMKESRELLLQRAKKIQDEYERVSVKEYTGDTVCPTCGQPLPVEQIESAKENFNQQKSEHLEKLNSEMFKINADGKKNCSKEMIVNTDNEIADISGKIGDLNNRENYLNETINAKSKELKTAAPFESTAEYASITAEIEKIKSFDDKASTLAADKITALQSEIKAIQNQISAYMAAKEHSNTISTQQKRIAELSSQEKNLAKEYEHYQQGIYLCETFIRSKVSLIDNRINSHFKTVRFKLFEEQINGGLKETCSVMVPCKSGLVPYSDANTASKVNAGLEIIEALSSHWKVSIPVFVDGAESVTRLSNINTQVIKLVVDEKYKELTVMEG